MSEPEAVETVGKVSRRTFLKRVAATGGALGLMASYPTVIERYRIVVNEYRLAVRNLPKAFAGLRIVHLSDLHYGFLVPLAVIRWVVRRANELKPDVIVCTGDYVHERNSTREIDVVWPVLSDLEARHGVYSVLGNHDHWADGDRSLHWLDRSGQNLRNRRVSLERGGQRLWLAGTGDFWEDESDLDVVLGQIPEEECRIVLAHNPDTADARHSGRVDLMLAGHTHGGQVRIPFIGAPVLPVRNKNYGSGIVAAPGGATMFISRGIGWAIYPIRFNCCPEIAVLELQPLERS